MLAKEFEDDCCEDKMEDDEYIPSDHDCEIDEIVLALNVTDEVSDEYQNLLSEP